jgi:hypothetical protein
MADYAIWGEAVGRGLGWAAGTSLAACNDNRNGATLADLLDSPLASALLEVGRGAHWSGSPADLHAELAEVVGKSVTARKAGRRASRSSAKSCAGSHPSFGCTASTFNSSGGTGGG